MATKCLTGGEHIQHGEVDKGTGYIPGGTERGDVRFYHVTQNGFKTYDFFTSAIFHLILQTMVDCWSRKTWKAKPWISRTTAF